MENNSKFTKIALAILLTLLLGYSAYATYTIIDLRNDVKNIENENNENNDNQSNNNETPNTQDQIAFENDTLKEYTHPNYPEVKIRYFQDWKIKVNDYEQSEELTSIATDILLTKSNITLAFHMYPTEMYDSTCSGRFYKYEDLAITNLENGWFRKPANISAHSSYIRDVAFNGTKEFNSLFDCMDLFYKNPDDYEFGIYDDSETFVVNYKDTNSDEGIGLLFINLISDGEIDNEIVNEADKIVTQSSYGFYIEQSN